MSVTLRPLADGDLDPLLAALKLPGIREWWGDEDADGLRNDGSAFAIEVDGKLAGWLGFSEEDDPDYPHVGLDIFLLPEHQGHGLGPEALRTAIRRFASERGHHRFTIDPSVANERAIRAYERVGFRPVGMLRSYERDPDTGRWRDGLLMDLLIEELAG